MNGHSKVPGQTHNPPLKITVRVILHTGIVHVQHPNSLITRNKRYRTYHVCLILLSARLLITGRCVVLKEYVGLLFERLEHDTFLVDGNLVTRRDIRMIGDEQRKNLIILDNGKEAKKVRADELREVLPDKLLFLLSIENLIELLGKLPLL